MMVTRMATSSSKSYQPPFKGTLEDGLAQARGAFERAFDFGIGLRDVGEFGFDLRDNFGLLIQRWNRYWCNSKLFKTKMRPTLTVHAFIEVPLPVFSGIKPSVYKFA